MDKNKTIIVIGAGKLLSSELIAQIHHSHGMDVVIISEEEAKEKGILPEQTLQIKEKPYIFRAQPQLPEMFYDIHQAKNDCKKGWKK